VLAGRPEEELQKSGWFGVFQLGGPMELEGWMLWKGQVVAGCFWSRADALCRGLLKWLKAAALG